MNIKHKMIVRGALLLAVALMAQQLRLILPLPMLVTTFIIGTVVNAVLVMAARSAEIFPAVAIAILLPVVAFMQGQLPLALLIPVVALGNIVFVVLCNRWWATPIFVVAPITKVFVLYLSTTLVLMSFNVPETIMTGILAAMGWPQLITAILGVLLAAAVEKRINFLDKN